MPQFDTTTKAVESVWKSPDGQREIFKVTLDYEGQSVQAKTFSTDIATVGWKGKVETYEKEGKGDYPAETYVKQPQKEGGYGGGGGGRSNYQPRDDAGIKAQFAIKAAVNALGPIGDEEVSVYTGKAYELATEFFSMVEVIKGEASTDTTAPSAPDTPSEPDTVHEVPDEPLNLDVIDDLFPGNAKTPVQPAEKPWPPKS